MGPVAVLSMSFPSPCKYPQLSYCCCDSHAFPDQAVMRRPEDLIPASTNDMMCSLKFFISVTQHWLRDALIAVIEDIGMHINIAPL